MDMLVREICDRDVRPEFPDAFPAGVRNLAAICWSAVAARRPSAQEAAHLYAEACKARLPPRVSRAVPPPPCLEPSVHPAGLL